MRSLKTCRRATTLLAFGLLSCSSHSSRPLLPGHSALLPSTEALPLVQQCSRAAPAAEATWQPSPSDIARLEADLPRLEGLQSTECCISGQSIKNVDAYLRQYVGLVVARKRYIYVNAIPLQSFDNWPPQVPLPNWRTTAHVICDGGPSHWGVLYDPVTRQFSELAFNGIG